MTQIPPRAAPALARRDAGGAAPSYSQLEMESYFRLVAGVKINAAAEYGGKQRKRTGGGKPSPRRRRRHYSDQGD